MPRGSLPGAVPPLYREGMRSRVLSAFAAVACAACSQSDEPSCPAGPDFVLQSDDGRTAFYSGCDVSRSLLEDNTYAPAPGDAYTLIEVPSALIPKLNDPTTVSLCDDAWDVRIEFHDGYCASTPDPNNPIITAASADDCVVHGVSGQEGVYGTVQLAWQNDHVTAVVDFMASVEYLSQMGTLDSLTYSRRAVLLGDGDIEDPLLSGRCGCSIGDECTTEE